MIGLLLGVGAIFDKEYAGERERYTITIKIMHLGNVRV